MKLSRTWWRWGLAAAGGLALGIWAAWPSRVTVDTAEVTVGPLVVTVDEEGTTRVQDRFVVTAPVTGRLSRIGNREGETVTRGQRLALLAPAPLDPRSRREATARYEAALDAERTARAAAAQARAALDQAARERARFESLFRQNVISAEARERAELEETTRRRGVEAADFQLQAATHQAEEARATLGTVSGSAPARIAVTAPVGGRILRVYEPDERVVAAGAPLLEVGDPGGLEVVVDLLSTDAVAVSPGDTMQLTGWGGASPLTAVVNRIEPSGFTKVSALGVEEQRVNVIGTIQDPAPTLGDRYRVDARIVIWQSPRVIRVPRGALFRSAGAWQVFVVDGGRARMRTVAVGRQALDQAEVQSGLREGERVILRPDERIDDGTRVRPREAGGG